MNGILSKNDIELYFRPIQVPLDVTKAIGPSDKGDFVLRLSDPAEKIKQQIDYIAKDHTWEFSVKGTLGVDLGVKAGFEATLTLSNKKG